MIAAMTSASDAARASYDALPYPGNAFPQSHPGRMAAQATLRGIDPPPVETARVLELGCGDGGNLIPMAFGLPGASFTGIDLNDDALARGRAHARALNLPNVDLRQGDLEQLEIEGPFDYVVAHGVYSWVSPAARDRLLHVAGRALSDQGVLYVSYNALPGGHLRQIVRELMQFATRGETDPRRIIEKARGAVQLVKHAQGPSDVYGVFLDEYLTKVLERSDAGVFHDDLEIHNEAVHVTQIVEHAERHGLQYLAEADMRESSFGNVAPGVADALDSLEPTSEVEQEQALDFLRLRMYRQTLFCRATAARNDVPDRDRLDRLHAYSPMHPEEPDANLDDDSVAVFVGRHDARMRTDHPAVKQAFARLGGAWPASQPIGELTQASVDPDAVRQAILGGHAAGLVQLTSHAPAIATTIDDRPAVSALARAQVADGTTAVTNLKHERIPIADADGGRLIALLDGTRDRAALLREMPDSERLQASLDRLKDLALLTKRP
jgi:SAM-dependent methyltransferase/methyltransferase-like protein